MKKVLFVLSLLLGSILAKAQQDSLNLANRDGGYFKLTRICSVDGVKAPDLYARALKWVSKTYKNPKNVIQSQDQSVGLLVINGINNDYRHKLMFEFKDGRYKWTIDEIKAVFPAFMRMDDKSIEFVPRYNRGNIENQCKLLTADWLPYINSFIESIKTSDDW